ncbi:carotenoid oxygenase family protein [Paremcibacter congregatus]|uniref:carotenoid oxygenase family protein n=1 Tax=Paremcibacter congregatus TaxID=2043170 RepID=UPI003A8D830F
MSDVFDQDRDLPLSERSIRTRADDGRPAPDSPAWTQKIDNPYLHGVYAPTTEEIDVADLEVIGELPDDLYGVYMRNGPNPVFEPNCKYHPFDGDGMVYAIYFKDGKASYKNRWVRTDAFQKEAEAGKAIWPGMMGEHDYSLEGFPVKDTSNTDLLYFNDDIVTLWYNAGIPYTLDRHTLKTKGRETFNGQLKRALSAHAKIDLEKNELIFFDYWDEPPYMLYGIADSNGDVIHQENIELPGPRLPHDIGFTENYVLLHDLPFFHDMDILQRTKKRIVTFHRDMPTRFGVQPRYGKGSEVKWFDCEPCYILHVVNCWEEGDWVIQVGCRSTNPMPKANPEEGELSHMMAYMRLEANMYIWKFNMKTGEVVEGDFDKMNTEFCRINPLYGGFKNRYSYNQYIMTKEDGVTTLAFGGLVKYDLESGGYERWDYGDGIYGSEAPFCPRRGATRHDQEDDGYVITYVTNSHTWQSECLIFDGKCISKGPIARVKMPHRLPYGFHANWARGEDIWQD